MSNLDNVAEILEAIQQLYNSFIGMGRFTELELEDNGSLSFNTTNSIVLFIMIFIVFVFPQIIAMLGGSYNNKKETPVSFNDLVNTLQIPEKYREKYRGILEKLANSIKPETEREKAMAYHASEYLRILTENNKNNKNGGSIRKRAKKTRKRRKQN